jgi:hypothetical protein
MDVPLEPRMKQIWEDGTTVYRPIYKGEPLEEENGNPEPSLHNLRKILADKLYVQYMFVGPHSHIFIVFTTGETYLATGFSIGDHGTKTKAFAQFSSEIKLGTPRECFQFLQAVEPEYTGVLFFPKSSLSQADGSP